MMFVSDPATNAVRIFVPALLLPARDH